MLKVLHGLFFPHERNNHRPKLLHLPFLYFFVVLVVFWQVGLSLIRVNLPGVLGFATNISPDHIVTLTNQERSKAGLGNLAYNSVLSQAALQKGSDMFAKNYWAHFAPDGTSPWSFFKSAGYSYVYAGENLARDFQNSSEVVAAWMASSTHRDNILSPNYTEIGVAVIDGVLSGEETTLVVQFFGKPSVSHVAQASTPLLLGGEDSDQPKNPPPSATLAPTKFLEPTPTPTTVVKSPEQYLQESTPPAALKSKESGPTQPPVYTLAGAKDFFLGISSFSLTKIFSLVLIGLLLLVLGIDSYLVVRNKISRISGKNLVHIAFLVVILLIIIITTAGRIM